MPLTPEEIQAQKRAVELNRNLRDGTMTAPTTPPNSIDSLVRQQGAVWKYSDEGAGGALLLTHPTVTGAAIKVEGWTSVNQANKVGNLMQDFLENSAGNPPFVAPRVKAFDSTQLAGKPQVAQVLDQQLKNAAATGQRSTGFQGDDENARLKWMSEEAQGKVSKSTDIKGQPMGVLVMELTKGKQMNRLPEDEKAALFRSEAFAQTIGRAMAPAMAMGLKDHLGTTASGLDCNVSNLMYDPDSGTLSVIDYDTHINIDPTDMSMKVGGGNLAKDGLKEMREFLEEAAESPDKFNEAIDRMINTNATGKSTGVKPTPFNDVMKAFCNPARDNFFNASQKGSLDGLSEEDKRQFATNLLKGAVEGLEYVQKNAQALENAVTNQQEVHNGQPVEHFYTQQDMADLRQDLNKLQPDKLKQQIASHANAHNQKRTPDIDSFLTGLDKNERDLQQKLADVQRKIDRIENHPTRGDKLKKTFTPKGAHPLDKLKSQEADLQKQLTMVGDLRTQGQTLKSRSEFYDKMDVESARKPGPKVTTPTQGQPNPGITTTPKVQGTTASGYGSKGTNVRSVIGKGPPTKEQRVEALQEKFRADDSGVNRQRAKPRTRDTTPGVDHTKDQVNASTVGKKVDNGGIHH